MYFKHYHCAMKLVKLCQIRYDRGQKVNLEKTIIKVLHFVLVNQEGSH